MAGGSDTEDLDIEVAVVGAGPAGCAIAATLHGAGVDVIVLDPRIGTDADVDVDGEELRVGEGAAPGLDRTIDEVFGPDVVAFHPDHHLRSYGNRAFWGHEHETVTDFMFNPFGPGWHLNRAAFDRDLIDALIAMGVRTSPCSVSGVAAERDRWMLRGDDGTTIGRARHVCDASGRRRTIARSLGAEVVTVDRLVAVMLVIAPVASSTGLGDRDTMTTVEAVEDGWWYTSPIPGDRRVLVHFTDPDLLQTTEWRDAPTVLAHARATTKGIAGVLHARPYEPASRPRTRAAGTSWLTHVHGSEHAATWTAVGDAATTFDPLSSQGLLTAIVTGRDCGHAIAALLHHDDRRALDAYASRVVAVRERYVDERATTYLLERRWPSSPFWRARHPDTGR